MELNTYVIRVDITDKLYKDYIVEAENLFFAKMKARNAFYKEFPGAEAKIKLSLQEPDGEKIKEIMDIIKKNIIKKEGEKND